MSAQSIALRLVIGGNSKGAREALKGINKEAGGLGKGLKTAQVGAAAGLAAITGVAVKGVSSYNDLGSATSKLTKLTNISAESASTMVGQWSRFNISAGTGTKAFTIFSKQLDAAKQGSAPMIKTFKRLGLSMDDLKKMSSAEALEAVRGKLSEMGPSGERTALMMKTLGRGGSEMLNWVNAAPADISKLNQSLAETGQVLSGPQLEAYKKNAKGQAEMKLQWDGLLLTVGGQIVPMLNKLTPVLLSVTKTLAPMGKYLLAAGAALGAFLVISRIVQSFSAFIAIMKSWAVVTKLVTAAQWLWNAALTANPIGIIILAVVALVAVFVVLWKKCDWFRNFWIGLWDKAKAAFASVLPVVKAVGAAIWGAIKAAWQKVMAVTRAVWDKIGPIIATAAKLWWAGVKTNAALVLGILRVAWGAVAAVTRAVWPVLAGIVRSAMKNIRTAVAVAKAIAGVIKSAWDAVARVTTRVWDGIKGTITGVIEWAVKKVTWLWDQVSAIGKKLKGMTPVGAAKAAGRALHLPGFGGAQAAGGDYLVTKPTLFLAGEAGRERATFTPQGKSMPGGGGPTIIVNIGELHGTDSAAATAFANKVARIVVNQQRMAMATGF